MSFMDKVQTVLSKTKNGIRDFVETAKVKHEVRKLNDRKTALLSEIGRRVYALYGQPNAVAEVDAQCKEIKDIDEQITGKGNEIARINTRT